MDTDHPNASMEGRQERGSAVAADENIPKPGAQGLGKLITKAEMELHPGNAQFKRLPGV